jgi:hypothetical protein
LEKSTSYEAPHYVVFSILLSLHLSLAQIFSSTPCSQTQRNISIYKTSLVKCNKKETFFLKNRGDRRKEKSYMEFWSKIYKVQLISPKK